jgi:hypothetical protein
MPKLYVVRREATRCGCAEKAGPTLPPRFVSPSVRRSSGDSSVGMVDSTSANSLPFHVIAEVLAVFFGPPNSRRRSEGTAVP